MLSSLLSALWRAELEFSVILINWFLTDIRAWMPSVTVPRVLTSVHITQEDLLAGEAAYRLCCWGKPGKNPPRSKTETLTILTFCLADSVKMPHLPQ